MVAGDVHGVGAFDEAKGGEPTGLRPTVGIKIGMKAALRVAVKMGAAAKAGLRKHGAETDAVGALTPVGEKLELAFAEELEPGSVDDGRIVSGIKDVIGARAFHRMTAERTGFEFTVFNDRAVDPAEIEAGVVNADALFDRSGIVRVGQVAGLLALDHLDIFVVEKITAAVSGGHGRDFSVLAPEIALADVVIVGDGNAGPAPEDFFEGEAELQPSRGVLFVIVALIAGEKDEVRILVIYVAGVFGAEAAVAV